MRLLFLSQLSCCVGVELCRRNKMKKAVGVVKGEPTSAVEIFYCMDPISDIEKEDEIKDRLEIKDLAKFCMGRNPTVEELRNYLAEKYNPECSHKGKIYDCFDPSEYSGKFKDMIAHIGPCHGAFEQLEGQESVILRPQ